MKLLDEFRQGCRRHYGRHTDRNAAKAREKIYYALGTKHTNERVVRHVPQIKPILDRVENRERALHALPPMWVPE